MNLDTYNPEMLALSLHIGNGREAPEGQMTLSLAHHTRCDISWGNTHEPGRREAVGCHSSAFCEWLAEDYPVGAFTDYEPQLYALLTELCLVQTEDFFFQARFTAGELTPSSFNAGWYPTLTLHRKGKRLSLILLGWSVSLIQQLTANWLPWDLPGSPVTAPFPLNVGHCSLTFEQLLALKAGDGIVMQSAPAIAENRLWINLQEKRLVVSIREHEIEVVGIQEARHSASGPEVINDMHSLPVQIVAEVAVARLAFTDLNRVTVGMIFPTGATFGGCVRLMVQGACIGHGSLIALNEVLVIRVDSLAGGSYCRPALKEALPESLDGMEEGEKYGLAD